MAVLPTGTVTFLFTDIEGSTRLAHAAGDRWSALLERHQAILRDAFGRHGGAEIATEGDSFFVVFGSAPAAVAATVDGQRALAEETWPGDRPIRVRMGLHTGEGALGGDNYVGLDVHRAARISAAGHGGQVVLSDATRALVAASLPSGVTLRNLGEHRLKDLPVPERIWQLSIEGIDSEFPPLRSLSSTNLPAEPTSFVGRAREVEAVVDLLESSRVVTLTGPGGTGKTRLSIRVGTVLRERFPDGVFFVALEPLRDAALFPSACAQVLGVSEQPGRTVLDGLADHVRDRELLLILDNFEQLMGAAPMVGTLIAAAPGLRALVTSREALHVAGEQEFPVPPMGVPRPDAVGDLEQLSQYEAVALFIARARAVRPDFVVTNENAPAVAEIAARLEGLPLAIELAGARVKLLGPHALLARLGSRLDLLSSAAVDVTDRQRTLRGAIGWSYDLLDETEQRLFARLSVFAGGATLDAIEAVAGKGFDLDALSVLSELVDKSLVRAIDAGTESRFAMLETIREYAAERLEQSGERDALTSRHAAHFEALALDGEPQLTGTDQRAWLERFEREIDNFRAVIRWALDGGDIEVGLRLGGALWRFWQQHSHLAEGRDSLERLIAHPTAQAPTAARYRSLNGLGGLEYWQGDYAGSRRVYEESLAVARDVGEPRLIAEAVFNLAYLDYQAGDFEAVDRHVGEARELFAAAGDRAQAARATNFLALAAFRSGDYEGARQRALETQRILMEEGRVFEASDVNGLIALSLSRLGDREGALRLVVEALDEYVAIGNLPNVSAVLDLIAVIETDHGHLDRAIRVVGASDALRAREGGMLSSLDILRLEHPRTSARAVLSDADIERYDAEGRAMTVEQVLDYVRKAPSAPGMSGVTAAPRAAACR